MAYLCVFGEFEVESISMSIGTDSEQSKKKKTNKMITMLLDFFV